MIPLTRNTDAEFPANFTGNRKVEWEKELLKNQRAIKQGGLKKHNFIGSRWKVTKKQLKKETHNKCGFCEVPFSVVAYGDVEHYRPKSVYWWLAYAYANYLPSCQICNQVFKKAKFPINGRKTKAPRITAATTDAFINRKAGKLAPDLLNNSAGLPMSAFIDAHHAERPLAINPYVDNPADYFAYEIDDIKREVRVIPADSSAKKFVEAAEKVYGINRKELNELRYFHLLGFRTNRAILTEPGISTKAKKLIRQAITVLKSDRYLFAGMFRYFDTLQNLPPLPDIDEKTLRSHSGEEV